MCLKCVLIASFIFIFMLVEAADDCVTPNHETAKCVHIADCPLLLKALSDATSRDFLNKSKCGTGLMICCGSRSNFTIDQHAKQNVSEASPLHIDQLNSTRNIENTTGIIAGNNSSSTKEEKIKLLPTRFCGLQHADDYFHTVNYTVPTEFPWIALVEVRTFSDSRPKSPVSGSLINPRYVLTISPNTISENGVPDQIVGVWLGGYHPLNETECLEDRGIYECADPPKYFEAEKVILSKHDSLAVLNFPIALVRLRETVRYSDFIRPICLPLPGTRSPQIGETLVESATEKWEVGESHSFGNGTKSRYYLKFEDKCEYNKFLERMFANRSDVVCLPSSDTNFINEPMGRPLMFSYRGKWYQDGIAMFRWLNVQDGDPYIGVYIKVSYYVDWILDNLEPFYT